VGKTKDENVKKALARCSGAVDCRCCPMLTTSSCIGVMCKGALELIKRLEKENKELRCMVEKMTEGNNV
jgi:hypothetical protein